MSQQYEQMDGPNLSPILQRLAMRAIPLLIGLVSIVFFAVGSCQRGPFGRYQIVPMSMEQESALGLQAFQEVLQKAHVIEHGPINDAVKKVVSRLVAAIDKPEFQAVAQPPIQIKGWAVEVVQSNEKNAFCLPGGKIVVYTGILPIAQTDAGLATVLGHEISHALSRHGNERMGSQEILKRGLMSVNGSLGDMDPQSRQQVLSVLNTGAQYGILHYSRAHESEADHMGLLLMAMAGYDPREALRFWHRMAEQTGGASVPAFASTHPSHGTRIHDLERLMPEAMPLYEASGHHEKAAYLPIGEKEGWGL